VKKAYSSVSEAIGHRIYLQSQKPLDKQYNILLDEAMQGYEKSTYQVTPHKSIQPILRDYAELQNSIQSHLTFEISSNGDKYSKGEKIKHEEEQSSYRVSE